MVARVVFPRTHIMEEHDPIPPTGDHKGPPTPTSTTLAPTDRPAACLTSQLRLMPMRADQSAVCTINRHLRLDSFVNRHNWLSICIIGAYWMDG